LIQLPNPEKTISIAFYKDIQNILNESEASTSDKPESVRVLRNGKVIISPDTPITKYNSLIEIYKLSFVNFLSFLKEETNNIYDSIVMSFSKFNLTLKNYTWLKALS